MCSRYDPHFKKERSSPRGRLFLFLGIVLIAAAVLALLFAWLNRFAFYHLMDGSSAQYAGFHHRMIVSFAAGIVLALAGAVCLRMRARR
jgi:uncharacterized membrane protein HdeD (DUF308 family)